MNHVNMMNHVAQRMSIDINHRVDMRMVEIHAFHTPMGESLHCSILMKWSVQNAHWGTEESIRSCIP